jgi:hypothetical protein
MSTALDEVIIERIAFLTEQLGAEDDPGYVRTFRAQIFVLQNAQLDRLDELITIRKTDLQQCRNTYEAERVYAELEALEWLQRQVMRHE